MTSWMNNGTINTTTITASVLTCALIKGEREWQGVCCTERLHQPANQSASQACKWQEHYLENVCFVRAFQFTVYLISVQPPATWRRTGHSGAGQGGADRGGVAWGGTDWSRRHQHQTSLVGWRVVVTSSLISRLLDWLSFMTKMLVLIVVVLSSLLQRSVLEATYTSRVLLSPASFQRQGSFTPLYRQPSHHLPPSFTSKQPGVFPHAPRLPMLPLCMYPFFPSPWRIELESISVNSPHSWHSFPVSGASLMEVQCNDSSHDRLCYGGTG